MPYTDLIKQENEYNYSANIQFDIENDYKLSRFIPNETTISLLNEYFVDITRDKPMNHARILYGSYGTGKSHFLTVLTLLLGKMHIEGDGYNSFISRIKNLDSNLASDIESYINDDKRKPFLIVPIVFDFEDFDRCIYFSLKKKLEEIGKKISFKTFFDQALSLIKQWKSNEESLEKLEAACDKTGISIQKLENMLNGFEKNSENLFQNVFSEMTYGVKYIYEVASLTDTIRQANVELKSDYEGIIFIFDEFGRYLEDNIKKTKVKSIQELAEFCDHFEENNHIILVSHKEISQYTQKQNKSLANEWKKVEGRYKATPISDKQDQCLSLIKNVLLKNDSVWDKFKERHKLKLNNMYSEASDFKGFLIDVAHDDNPFEGGFPLHPIALYTLDKLSKKVAQNERTFFTYLASKDENSLYSFLRKTDLDEFHFVGIDQIYDYFEPNIKAVQSDSSYQWYKNLQSALAKCHLNADEDCPETKILKVIATIGIINDSSTLRANKNTILSVIDCPREILSNALLGLCELRVIKYSGSYDRYDFYEASIYDVEKMIEEKSSEIKDEAVINTLNEEFVDFALYPHEYNRTYKVKRVFVPFYSTLSSFTKNTVSQKLGKYYDGALVMLLAETDDTQGKIVSAFGNIERTILYVNNNAAELKMLVKQYVATKYLESKKNEYIKNDPSFEKELSYFKREISATIFSSLNAWKNGLYEDNTVYYNGEPMTNICSINHMSELASKICFDSFPDTLIVNNELINKNVISGSISSAKKNVINGILCGQKAEDYYGVPFLSPDYISARSVLAKNGFMQGVKDLVFNTLPDGKQPQDNINRLICSYITKAQNEQVSFEEIYSVLKNPPYGLRDGYLSLLIAHCLIPYKKSLIVSSHNVEQELTVDLFEEIVKRPHDYNFTIASWSIEQIDYIDSLEQLFSEYIKVTSLNKNRLKAIYDAMLLHYKNISKFARTTNDYVSNETKEYRKLMEKTITNYSMFFFKKMSALGDNLFDTVKIVKDAKNELENSVYLLSKDIADSICNIFSMSNVLPLGEVFEKQYKEVWSEKRQKSFDYYTNAFLEFSSNAKKTDYDYDLVVKLTKAITGLELVYWNDGHKSDFIKILLDIKNKLDTYNNTNSLSSNETKITMSSSGEEKSIVFDRDELNVLSKTIKNKIKTTFGNYGMSISYDDKIQILLSLIEDLLEGK